MFSPGSEVTASPFERPVLAEMGLRGRLLTNQLNPHASRDGPGNSGFNIFVSPLKFKDYPAPFLGDVSPNNISRQVKLLADGVNDGFGE